MITQPYVSSQRTDPCFTKSCELAKYPCKAQVSGHPIPTLVYCYSFHFLVAQHKCNCYLRDWLGPDYLKNPKMCLPGTRINRNWKKGSGRRQGWKASQWSTNTGCENPAVMRDGAGSAADQFLISQPAVSHTEFCMAQTWRRIITRTVLGTFSSQCVETESNIIHCPSSLDNNGGS